MQSAYCQASDGGVEGVRPPRAFSHRFFAQKSGVAEGRCLQSSPQSGSGRKEQPKSKAAIRSCTHSFAQRVQSAYCQASDGGVEGVRPPRAFSHRFFAQKSGVAEGRCLQSSPQSGSGRKEQPKSKAAKSAAAPRRCTLIRLLKADLI